MGATKVVLLPPPWLEFDRCCCTSIRLQLHDDTEQIYMQTFPPQTEVHPRTNHKLQDRTSEFTRTTESNEGSTPPNGIESGKRTTESNQGSNPRIRNPKSEIQNPQFE